jgi:hypothetical protein
MHTELSQDPMHELVSLHVGHPTCILGARLFFCFGCLLVWDVSFTHCVYDRARGACVQVWSFVCNAPGLDGLRNQADIYIPQLMRSMY